MKSETVAQGIPVREYDQREPDDCGTVTANPPLNFLSAFALRRKESRLGHCHVPIEKKSNEQNNYRNTKYMEFST